jgi:hypothetical protein
MPRNNSDLIDLLDLKMLPAWVKEPEAIDYSRYRGEGNRREPRTGSWTRAAAKQMRKVGPRSNHRRHRTRAQGRELQQRARGLSPQVTAPALTVRFLPEARPLENVAAQIKAGAVAYSLFALARVFLQKPQRYRVQLMAKPEFPLFQLGENGAVSANRQFLEGNAFRFAQSEFYRIETTQTDPIKGNFTNVARDRLSGILLGPTNHHSYQPRLRSLYEQRFSRRMSFADYQRQIEIVSDPVLVDQWKEEARTATTYTTLREEPPLTFNSAAQAERHLRKTYLRELVRRIDDATVDGLTSRQMPDRILRRLIENAWAAQNRSPWQMMQELAMHLREVDLHIFRHRRGMLFVSPIRVRPFAHATACISPQVQAILQAIAENPRTKRKELADKVILEGAAEETESRKLALAADLHWLIDEGYVIEFNDGSLDLPRAKILAQAATLQTEQIASQTLTLA